MAKNRGWWELKLTSNTSEELSDIDKEHIAELIVNGYTSGEIVEDEDRSRDE